MKLKAALFAALLAAPTLTAQNQVVRIHAATIVDGTGKTLKNATIVVQGSKITSIETGSAGNVSYELGQLTVVPGLIDVHAHVGWHFDKSGRYANRPGTPAQEILYSAENAYVTLMAGFTTIQSPGQANDVELREGIARGVFPGPRILTSIRQINERSGTPDEIKQKVRQLKTDGADVIKIFASASIRDGGKQTMTDEQLVAVCGEANAQGMRTMVHAHSPESIKASVNAGCQQIEHGVFATDEVLKLMAGQGSLLRPERRRRAAELLEEPRQVQRHRQLQRRRLRLHGEGARPQQDDDPEGVATPKLMMVLGTDAVAGAHGHNADEIVERVRQGGQKPMDAIISATSMAAKSMRLDKEIGTLASGYEADIVGLDGDPMTDITA
jgi:Imidazolonepropionase and related amidohydrolases